MYLVSYGLCGVWGWLVLGDCDELKVDVIARGFGLELNQNGECVTIRERVGVGVWFAPKAFGGDFCDDI